VLSENVKLTLTAHGAHER